MHARWWLPRSQVGTRHDRSTNDICVIIIRTSISNSIFSGNHCEQPYHRTSHCRLVWFIGTKRGWRITHTCHDASVGSWDTVDFRLPSRALWWREDCHARGHHTPCTQIPSGGLFARQGCFVSWQRYCVVNNNKSRCLGCLGTGICLVGAIRIFVWFAMCTGTISRRSLVGGTVSAYPCGHWSFGQTTNGCQVKQQQQRHCFWWWQWKYCYCRKQSCDQSRRNCAMEDWITSHGGLATRVL